MFPNERKDLCTRCSIQKSFKSLSEVAALFGQLRLCIWRIWIVTQPTQSTMSDNDNQTLLQIRQPNNNKSLVAKNDLLAKCLPDRYDIIVIQGLYLDFQGNAQATTHWYLIYPNSHYKDQEKWTWLMIIINRWITTDVWAAVDVGYCYDPNLAMS